MRLCSVCVYNENGVCNNQDSKFFNKNVDDIPEDYHCPYFIDLSSWMLLDMMYNPFM